jgi:hypothetical protein
MDGTIPMAAGQWILETATNVLAWPGLFGWGAVTGYAGPRALMWVAKKVNPKRR